MTKATARHGGSPAPYTKHRKVRHRYPATPLHKEGEGIAVTPANVRAFNARLGLPVSNYSLPLGVF
jgi:hypothetical protein